MAWFFFFNLIAILNYMHHKKCLKMHAKKDAKKMMFIGFFFFFFVFLLENWVTTKKIENLWVASNWRSGVSLKR